MSMITAHKALVIDYEKLAEVAKRLGISPERAERELRNSVYRKEYRKLYNKRDYVVEKRREENKSSYRLRRNVTQLYKS